MIHLTLEGNPLEFEGDINNEGPDEGVQNKARNAIIEMLPKLELLDDLPTKDLGIDDVQASLPPRPSTSYGVRPPSPMAFNQNNRPTRPSSSLGTRTPDVVTDVSSTLTAGESKQFKK